MSNVHADQNNAIEDGCGQIMESNALASLLKVFEDSSWISRCSALEAIIALAEYGKT